MILLLVLLHQGHTYYSFFLPQVIITNSNKFLIIMKTRNKCTKDLAGYQFVGRETLPRNGKLPVGKDIVERALSEKEWRTESTAKAIAKELIALWIECTVYTKDFYTVWKMIHDYINSFDKLMRYPKTKRNDLSFTSTAADFTLSANSLFDIFCNDSKKRKEQEEKYKLKMVQKDYEFYNDQKGARVARCYLSTTERPTVADINFKRRLSQAEKRSIPAESTAGPSTSSAEDPIGEEIDKMPVNDDEDGEFSPLPSCSPAKGKDKQNRTPLKNLAMTCDRFNSSDREAAAIASAVLKDYGIITDDDYSQTIDRSKLRRERDKYRKQIREEEAENFKLVNSLYFDGKKDATVTVTECNGRYYRQIVIEEHIEMVGEPGSYYLSHVTPENGTGRSIAGAMHDEFKDTELDEALDLAGGDGTAANTGKWAGAIRVLEETVCRPLQWSIC